MIKSIFKEKYGLFFGQLETDSESVYLEIKECPQETAGIVPAEGQEQSTLSNLKACLEKKKKRGGGKQTLLICLPSESFGARPWLSY